MRAPAFGVAILLASTATAFGDDIMAGYYGNTIIAQSASTDLHIHYNPDHTFDATGTNANGPISLKGKWMLDKKGNLCRKYNSAPPDISKPVCTPWSARSVGDRWEMPGVTLTLVEGIQ